MSKTVGVVSTLHGSLADDVKQLWKFFEAQYGSKGVQTFDYPNVAYQGGQCKDTTRLENALGALSRTLSPFDLLIDGFGYFDPSRVVFLRVIPTDDLMRIYRAAHDVIEQQCTDLFDLYRPSNWVPHVTVAMTDLTEENFVRAKRELSTRHPQYRQTLDNLTLAQIDTTTGLVSVIASWKLGADNDDPSPSAQS